ncbi:hypothetical protein ACQJBY_023835 [Aegilops geniculata]
MPLPFLRAHSFSGRSTMERDLYITTPTSLHSQNQPTGRPSSIISSSPTTQLPPPQSPAPSTLLDPRSIPLHGEGSPQHGARAGRRRPGAVRAGQLHGGADDADGVAQVAAVRLQGVHGVRLQGQPCLPRRQLRLRDRRRGRPHGRGRPPRLHRPPQAVQPAGRAVAHLLRRGDTAARVHRQEERARQDVGARDGVRGRRSRAVVRGGGVLRTAELRGVRRPAARGGGDKAQGGGRHRRFPPGGAARSGRVARHGRGGGARADVRQAVAPQELVHRRLVN